MDSLKISNYRCIGKLELTELTPITILVGRNNTGKSALLETVALASTAKVGWHDSLGDDLIAPIIKKRGGMDFAEMIIKMGEKKAEIVTTGETTSGRVEIAHDFSHLSDFTPVIEGIERYFEDFLPNYIKSTIEPRFGRLSARDREFQTKRLMNLIDMLRSNFSKYSKLFLTYNDNDISEPPEYAIILDPNYWDRVLTDHEDSFLIRTLATNELIRSTPRGKSNTLFLLTPNVEYLKELQRRLAKSGELLKLIRYLKNKIEYFEDLREIEDTFLVFQKGLRSPVPLEGMGDGFRAELAILAAIATVKKGVALMEEPEIRMHPGYMATVVDQISKTADSGDLQYVISTHSSDFIELMLETNLELIKVVRLYRKEEKDGIDYEVFEGAEAKEEIETLCLDLRGV